MGVLMDLILATAEQRRLGPASLLTSATVHGPSRKDLVCEALSYRRGGAVWMSVQRPFWRSETIAFYGARAMVEPPNVKMIGYARCTTEPTRVVTFYASDPDTTFLDLYARIRSSRRSDCAPTTFSLAWQATRYNVASAEASPRPAR